MSFRSIKNRWLISWFSLEDQMMTVPMFKIKFEEDTGKGRVELMKLEIQRYTYAENQDGSFFVSDNVLPILDKNNLRYKILCKFSLCCQQFNTFYRLRHIGKPKPFGTLDKLYFIFQRNGIFFPEGSPIRYCPWCGEEVDHACR